MTEIILFQLGSKDLFALPVHDVKEIVAMSTIHRWPGSSEHFLGCMDVRGSTVPIVDLPGLLQIQGDHSGAGFAIILDMTPPYGLKVDKVSSIEKYEINDQNSASSKMPFTDFGWVQDDGALVQVLSASKIISRITERAVA